MKILLQRDAASHDSGEFGIVHHVTAGVVGEIFFHDFFYNPANAGGNAGESCGVHDCFHKLVVRHLDIIEKLFFQLMASLHCESFSSHCESSSSHCESSSSQSLSCETNFLFNLM